MYYEIIYTHVEFSKNAAKLHGGIARSEKASHISMQLVYEIQQVKSIYEESKLTSPNRI